MALSFPSSGLSGDCILLAIPVELVPIVGGLFASIQYRAKWSSDDDYKDGSRAIRELEAQLMNNCFSALIQEIRDLRGVKPDYEDVPVGERTSDMYRSINDLTVYLNNIHFALNGASELDDNILMALRGETAASAERNVLEALS